MPKYNELHRCDVSNWNLQDDGTWTCRDCGAVIPDKEVIRELNMYRIEPSPSAESERK